MTERIGIGTIREILIHDKLIGDSPFRITVGNEVPAGKNQKVRITEIVRDDNSAILFGALRYIVYAVKTNDPTEEIFPWRTYEGPFKIETISII